MQNSRLSRITGEALKWTTIFGTALALAGCAHEAPIVKTPSGFPEAFFPNSGLSVRERISADCMSAGLFVSSAAGSEVECSKTLQGGDAILAALAIGNTYSTNPVQHVVFTVVPYEGGSRVQAHHYIETQTALGQVRRLDLNNGEQFNDLQGFLYKIGGQNVTAFPAADPGIR
jgi:hypothetical protein